MQIELQQSPERYSYKSGVWKISAKSDINPIEIIEDTLNLKVSSLLSVEGVIVHIRDTDIYLGSKKMVTDLRDSAESNPHYTYKEHSKILGAKMGKTIPILEVNLSDVEESIEKQKEKGKFAGVKSVKWALEEDYKGLIEQINWTLSPTSPKPLDSYNVFDLNLSGDYTITALPIVPLDDEKRIPDDILASNLKIINERLIQLRNDFNSIKDLFYFGNSINSSTTNYEVLSSSEGEEFEVQVVTKNSVMVSKSVTPSTQLSERQSELVKEVKSDIESSKNSLQQRISNNEALIQSAQAGDKAAQMELDTQLTNTKGLIKGLTDRLNASKTTS